MLEKSTLEAAAKEMGFSSVKALQNRIEYTNIAPSTTNEILEVFLNKVLISILYKHTRFIDPYNKAFIKAGTDWRDATEVFSTKPITPIEYTKDKRYPDTQNRATNINYTFETILRKTITNTVPLIGFQAAFASETAFSSWVAEQTAILQESRDLYMFGILQDKILDHVKNTITLKVDNLTEKKWDKRFIEINRLTKDMTLPSVKYCLGYEKPKDSDKDTRIQVAKRKDLWLMMNPSMQNSLEGEVQTVKYHNEYFKIESYKGILISDKLDDNELLIIHKKAGMGHWRVDRMASNFWALPVDIEYFMHFWVTFGMPPWAIATHVKFETDGSANTLKRVGSVEEAEKAVTT